MVKKKKKEIREIYKEENISYSRAVGEEIRFLLHLFFPSSGGFASPRHLCIAGPRPRRKRRPRKCIYIYIYEVNLCGFPTGSPGARLRSSPTACVIISSPFSGRHRRRFYEYMNMFKGLASYFVVPWTRGVGVFSLTSFLRPAGCHALSVYPSVDGPRKRRGKFLFLPQSAGEHNTFRSFRNGRKTRIYFFRPQTTFPRKHVCVA